jgi:uncharacterized protein YutE (UPF0331/DUF86 family)
MDREVIEQKIESLRRCVERVRQKCPATAAALAGDPDAQDILTLNLSRAVQLCVDIGAHLIAEHNKPAPDTMGQTFDVLAEMGVISAELAVRMKKAVGFRNIAVHNYEAIDWEITHAIATRHMSDFAAFASAVVAATGI